MKKLLILQGLPACGKSSYASRVMANEPGKWKRVNKDLLRMMIDDGKWSNQNEKGIIDARNNLILMFLSQGFSVIVDDTNFGKHEETLKNLIGINMGKVGKVQLEKMFFDVPVEECIKRDLARTSSVGQGVILGMYNKYLKPETPEIKWVSKRTTAIVCDIDGTLARMVNRGPFEWSKVGQDKVNLPVVDILEKYQSFADIILLSGRDSVCKKETESWLKNNNIEYKALFMREEGNNEKDSILKKRLYETHIKPNCNVLFVLDDRPQVVRMWKNLGLFVIDCNQGDSRIEF